MSGSTACSRSRWDAPRRRLFIARDRLGKKPLHYRIDRDGIAFASEPKAFLAEPGFTREVDLQAVSHYLTCSTCRRRCRRSRA